MTTDDIEFKILELLYGKSTQTDEYDVTEFEVLYRSINEDPADVRHAARKMENQKLIALAVDDSAMSITEAGKSLYETVAKGK